MPTPGQPVHPPQTFDSRQFRDALGEFATGVTIICARTGDGRYVGLTANSFNSVSLDPPLVMWSLSRRENIDIRLSPSQERLSTTVNRSGPAMVPARSACRSSGRPRPNRIARSPGRVLPGGTAAMVMSMVTRSIVRAITASHRRSSTCERHRQRARLHTASDPWRGPGKLTFAGTLRFQRPRVLWLLAEHFPHPAKHRPRFAAGERLAVDGRDREHLFGR